MVFASTFAPVETMRTGLYCTPTWQLSTANSLVSTWFSCSYFLRASDQQVNCLSKKNPRPPSSHLPANRDSVAYGSESPWCADCLYKYYFD